MNVEIRHPGFRSVVGDDVEFEQLGTGFLFTEGPIWHPLEEHLIFSDIPGSHMRRWRDGEGVTSFRDPSHMANGNAYDRQGRIVTCEHSTSRVTRTEADGSVVVLVSHWNGKELNSPNDVIVNSDGAIYFTDPTYGRIEYYGVARDQELSFQGVYRIDADDNALTLLADDFEAPNGLCFSLDERSFVHQRHGTRAYQGLRRRRRRDDHERRCMGGADGRRRGTTRRHEDRQRGEPLLHRTRRHSRFRSRGPMPRRDPGFRTRRQLCLGRRRHAQPVHYRLDIALPNSPERFPATRRSDRLPRPRARRRRRERLEC